MARGYDDTVIPLIQSAGPKMKERRLELGMTFQDVTLASHGFVTGNFLSSLENGTVEGGITFYRLALLGEVYKLTPHELYELVGMGNLLSRLDIRNTKYRLIETKGE